MIRMLLADSSSTFQLLQRICTPYGTGTRPGYVLVVWPHDLGDVGRCKCGVYTSTTHAYKIALERSHVWQKMCCFLSETMTQA